MFVLIVVKSLRSRFSGRRVFMNNPFLLLDFLLEMSTFRRSSLKADHQRSVVVFGVHGNDLPGGRLLQLELRATTLLKWMRHAAGTGLESLLVSVLAIYSILLLVSGVTRDMSIVVLRMLRVHRMVAVVNGALVLYMRHRVPVDWYVVPFRC